MQQREAQLDQMKATLESEQHLWKHTVNKMRAELERTESVKDRTLTVAETQSLLHCLTSGPSGSGIQPIAEHPEEETPGEKANTTDSVYKDGGEASDATKTDGNPTVDDPDAPADVVEAEAAALGDTGDDAVPHRVPLAVITSDAKKKRTRLDEEKEEPEEKTGSDSPKVTRLSPITFPEANVCFVSGIEALYRDLMKRRCAVRCME